MASRQSLARAAVEYKEAKLVLLKTKGVWMDLLINEPAIDSDFDEFYRETGTRRPGPSGLIKDILMRCRDSVGHLLHPETGYLLPLTVLLTAIPLGVIAFNYQREAFIRFTCAGGRGKELVRIEKALGMKDIEGISSSSRIDHLCEKY